MALKVHQDQITLEMKILFLNLMLKLINMKDLKDLTTKEWHHKKIIWFQQFQSLIAIKEIREINWMKKYIVHTISQHNSQ